MNMFKILLRFLHSSVKCMHDTCLYDTSSHHSSQGVCKGAVYERPVSMAAIA